MTSSFNVMRRSRDLFRPFNFLERTNGGVGVGVACLASEAGGEEEATAGRQTNFLSQKEMYPVKRKKERGGGRRKRNEGNEEKR